MVSMTQALLRRATLPDRAADATTSMEMVIKPMLTEVYAVEPIPILKTPLLRPPQATATPADREAVVFTIRQAAENNMSTAVFAIREE